VTTNSSPLVQRRRLRAELKQARQNAELTQDSVAEQMEWSLSKIIRIETGAVGISRNDLLALLHLYQIDDPQEVARLTELGRIARQQSWYSMYREQVPPIYFQYIEYETSASSIRNYESLIIPGLLQTEQYATKVMTLYRNRLEPDLVRARVEIRMKRQKFLMEREDSPQLFFVLDEAVIYRLMGDEATRQDQIDRLISTGRRPGVSIEIVPSRIGLYSGMGENFTHLAFSDPNDDDVLYFESAREAIFSQDEDEISIYRELFEGARDRSLGPEESLEYLIERSRQGQLGPFPRTLTGGSTHVFDQSKGGEIVIEGQTQVPWRVSSWSNGTNCIEVAIQSESVQIRDSKNRGGGTLCVPAFAWQKFIEVVQPNRIS
jgi:transcriptional regulator with XRE-family HTH domain